MWEFTLLLFLCWGMFVISQNKRIGTKEERKDTRRHIRGIIFLKEVLVVFVCVCVCVCVL